ncbi:hypothetical protein DFH08DRAFT_437148 [Mycena albidolilacea]|uniref:Uncharacterized protein n=1 Tax=Mycena albidolilacea TaxID=1033008 RepID=A0AAD7AG14_9AGAR|nr:hypothetical protein DFH08DRAFT_437148 [Mycena albidolilacea]
MNRRRRKEGGSRWEGRVSRGRETRRLGERRHRMPFCVCCNASLASRPRYGRSFRLENWVEPHSESFFHRRLRLPISSHFDSTRLVPFHTSSPSRSVHSCPLLLIPTCTFSPAAPPHLSLRRLNALCAFHLATSRTRHALEWPPPSVPLPSPPSPSPFFLSPPASLPIPTARTHQLELCPSKPPFQIHAYPL